VVALPALVRDPSGAGGWARPAPVVAGRRRGAGDGEGPHRPAARLGASGCKP